MKLSHSLAYLDLEKFTKLFTEKHLKPQVIELITTLTRLSCVGK